jgi:alpha-tubulin suppressor-like RCC1 family protein
MNYTHALTASLLLLCVAACETDPPGKPFVEDMNQEDQGVDMMQPLPDMNVPADMGQDMPDMTVEPDMEPDLPPPDPCEGVDCGEHGTCAPSGDQPSCVCDTSYVPEGLGCALEPTAPVIENLPGEEAGGVGKPDTFQLVGSDANPDDTLSWSVTSTTCAFPVIVDADTGLVSWTCSPTTADCEAVLAAEDDGGLLDEGTLSIACANGLPAFTSVPPTQGSEGALVSYTVACADPDGAAVTLSVAPDDTCGGTLAGDVYSFTPDESQGGTSCLLRVLCDDGESSEAQSSMVAIAEVNIAPAFSSLPGMSSARWGRGATFMLTATDADLPANQLTYSLTGKTCSFPVNVTPTGSLTYTCGAAAETCTATAQVSDGSATAQGQLSITCTNAAPAFSSTAPTMASEGQTTSYTPACADTDGDTVSITLTNNTCGGQLVGGVFSFVPTEAQGGTTCSAQLRCDDSIAQATQNITITIAETNQAPTFSSLPGMSAALWGRMGSFVATANDADLPAQSLTFSLASKTCSFPVTVAANGAISFTCGMSVETCAATVRVSDGQDNAQRDLSISCTNGTPAVSNVAITPNPIPAAGAPLTCNYMFADPDGDADQSTVQWLVGGVAAGTGQSFTAYGPMASVTCRVTPRDSIGAGTPVTSPAIVAPAAPIVAAGESHTCAIFNGALKCWGSNLFGQLGTGNTTSSNLPVQVTGLTSGVTAVAAGGDHTCAIHNGALKCWGYNSSGRLGDGTTTDRNTPTAVTGMTTGVTAISAGQSHTCAIKSGALTCWGSNGSGRLGDTTTTDRNAPTAVTNMATGVTAVAADFDHTCAIKSGALFCWGYGASGQIGDGANISTSTPTAVTNMASGVTAVASGFDHTCAIKSGALFCWGSNSDGRLGNNTTTSANIPVAVSSMASNVTSIEVGDNHSCAVQSGALQCWGSNTNGQLGTGNNTQSLIPTQVSGLTSGLNSIASGNDHMCAVQNGPIKCWGYNSNGQLGDNTTTSRNTPTLVTIP